MTNPKSGPGMTSHPCQHHHRLLDIHDSWCFFFYLMLLHQISPKINLKNKRISLVAQLIRIHLPTQGTWVQSLVREDSTCRRATKPMHNYCARVMQLLKPVCLQPALHNKRSHPNERPTHCDEEKPQLTSTEESPHETARTWSGQ